MTSYFDARSADGPGLYQWLQTKGLLELVNQSDTDGRRARCWRDGAMAEFHMVDKVLTRCHVHPIDIPDGLWRDLRASDGPLVERRCKKCSRRFVTPGTSLKVFCSTSCRDRAAPRVSFCGQCGVRMVKAHGGSAKKWCSSYCRSVGNRKAA